MTDLLSPSAVQGGSVGLLALVVLMVLRGLLVPRSTLKDMREERDTWRSAYQESEASRRKDQAHVGELLELSRTAIPLLRALPTPQVPAEEVAGAPVDQGVSAQT